MSERQWTVLELLKWTTDYFGGKGIDGARLDAEVLLAHALGCDRLRLYVDYEKPVTPEERTRFRELVKRRADERVPVAYLVGTKEFWSLSFEVTPDVLIPRPDTETLVEAALGALPEVDAEVTVLDVGTGSGAIALALASERPKARITATDASPEALAVAARNAERLGLADRVVFVEGDGLAAIEGQRFDAIVSNPPYVRPDAVAGLAPELAHEPAQALSFGDAADGTALLERIVADAPARLAARGWLGLELDPAQATQVQEWMMEGGFGDVTVHRDLGGRPRVVAGRWEE